METPVLLIHNSYEQDLAPEPLNAAGFRIEATDNAEEGVSKALSGQYALTLIGGSLARVSGLELLRRIRRESLLPILLVSEQAGETERVLSFEAGADDYLCLPVSPEELIVRMRAILRRTRGGVSGFGHLLKASELELDRLRRKVKKNGEEIALTTAEFDLLELLIQHAGQAVSREEISNCILGRPLHPHDRSIDVHVSNLRKKLDCTGSGSERIRAIRGVGYSLIIF